MHSEQVLQDGIKRAKSLGRDMPWLRRQLLDYISNGSADREDLRLFDRLTGNVRTKRQDPLQGELF